ncbi:enoyl-CoA hydratase/isomerase family protein [Patescibacteria group bacterium]|nr:enoyl-CoA hydratase/isomerase family protein [Patescibacteria group bacterium]MBU1075345.1 enoyl-CoA hydratase/isomerase family protein [Patescibacteria group bacterium]MBU1951722.1 enoyl-CoA hydratase/isomerase family protein [Patescibacteria group bacterium]
MARVILEPGIWLIIVNNTRAFNALSSAIIAELVADFEAVCADPATRVVIFRGVEVEGKYLAPLAGADLKDLVDISDPENPQPVENGNAHLLEGACAIHNIRRFCRRGSTFNPKDPGHVLVLGMVDGPCLAGGMEFMFGLSDLVLATPRSKFGMREILLGGMGGWCGPETLRKILCSPMWIKEMLLAAGDQKSGDIDAATAMARGLVNRLYHEDNILEATNELAQHLASLDPYAVTCNLAAAEFDWSRDCTNDTISWMTNLMMGDAWVRNVSAFLAGQR